jgi:hypothetical protein
MHAMTAENTIYAGRAWMLKNHRMTTTKTVMVVAGCLIERYNANLRKSFIEPVYTHQRKEMQSSKQHQNTQPYRNEEEHGECIENKPKQTGKCQAIQLEKK